MSMETRRFGETGWRSRLAGRTDQLLHPLVRETEKLRRVPAPSGLLESQPCEEAGR